MRRLLRVHSTSGDVLGTCWCQVERRKRFLLSRWHKRTQLDIDFGARWLSIGVDRHSRHWRLIAYISPDATPVHLDARGLKVGD